MPRGRSNGDHDERLGDALAVVPLADRGRRPGARPGRARPCRPGAAARRGARRGCRGSDRRGRRSSCCTGRGCAASSSAAGPAAAPGRAGVGDGEPRAAADVAKLRSRPTLGSWKPVRRRGHASVEVVEAGHDLGDPVADAIVVGRELVPAERPAPSSARPSAATIAGSLRSSGLGRREHALRPVDHAHRVLDRDELGRRRRSLRPRHGRISARAPGWRWVRLSLVEIPTGQRAALERARGAIGVGCGRDEVAAQRDEHARPRRDRSRGSVVDRVEPARAAARTRTRRRARRGTPCLRLVGDAHRAIALHVGVPAHRAQPRARPADVAAQRA